MVSAVALFLSLMLPVAAPVTEGDVTFVPTARETDVAELFRMTKATYHFEMQELRVTPNYKVSAVRFPSPIVTEDVSNNTVHAEYFQPIGESKRPAVIMLHILGADFALSRYFCARLAERGVASLFIKLPYYGERRPPGSKEKRFLSTDIPRSVASMRQGVQDVRRGASWLASRPEIDANRLGVAGISLGGIVSSIAAANDPTLNKAAFLLAGGNLHDVLWTMDEPEADKYRKMWLDSGRTYDDLKRLVAPLDPITYAHHLKGKKLMMMAGNVDEVVPPSATKALWEAAGKPPITWFDCGHYSAAGYLLPAIREAVDFFVRE
jgi:dienelactone hydrolase